MHFYNQTNNSSVGRRSHTSDYLSTKKAKGGIISPRRKVKITDDQVRRMRHLHEVDGYEPKLVHEIMAQEGVECHIVTVKSIINYLTRADVTGGLYSKTFPRFN
jgi:hypothetical protein